MAARKPAGTILYRGGEGAAVDVSYAVAKWRDSSGRQRYRRLGPAWVEPDRAGGWRKRRGRPPEDYLDRRTSHFRCPARIARSVPFEIHERIVAGLMRNSSAISARVSQGSSAAERLMNALIERRSELDRMLRGEDFEDAPSRRPIRRSLVVVVGSGVSRTRSRRRSGALGSRRRRTSTLRSGLALSSGNGSRRFGRVRWHLLMPGSLAGSS